MRFPRAPFATWDASSPSRRLWIAVVALGVAAVALAFAGPPLSTAIDRAQSDVVRTRSLLDVAQAHIADSASLARTPAPLHAGDLLAAVDRVMARHQLRAAPVSSPSGDGRYTVVVDDARFDAVVSVLDELGREEGVRVVEATLTARIEPGRVRADLTFAR